MTSKKLTVPLLVLMLAVLVPAVSIAATVWMEAEDYTDSYDLMFEAIRVITIDGCTNGVGMTGMDVIGEWVEYPLVVSSFGLYTFTLHYRAAVYGMQYSIRLHLTGGTSGQVQVMDIFFPGYGFG